jgi:hypothetical protein
MTHLVVLLLLGVYGVGVWKFWTGFRSTQFESGRIVMGLLWPVMIFNGRYRRNFTRALKGR